MPKSTSNQVNDLVLEFQKKRSKIYHYPRHFHPQILPHRQTDHFLLLHRPKDHSLLRHPMDQNLKKYVKSEINFKSQKYFKNYFCCMYIVSEIQNEAFKNAYSIVWNLFIFIFSSYWNQNLFWKQNTILIDLHALKNFYKIFHVTLFCLIKVSGFNKYLNKYTNLSQMV